MTRCPALALLAFGTLTGCAAQDGQRPLPREAEGGAEAAGGAGGARRMDAANAAGGAGVAAGTGGALPTPDAAASASDVGGDNLPVGMPTGALEVMTGEKVVNECFSLTRHAGAEVTLAGAGTIAKGATLLLWQVQDRLGAKSGDAADVVSVEKMARAGAWELAVVAAVNAAGDATTVTLSSAPKGSYGTAVAEGRAAQACVVPAYTNATIGAGAKISAKPWDGKSGGVVAFTVAGTLTIDGEITATGAGFRGGPWTKTHYHADDNPNRKMTDLDTVSAFGGYKGEGLEGGEWPKREGRGNLINGAGGGNNTHAGGGGGGNAAKGGFGGMQHGFYGAGEPNTRGMPGVGVKLSAKERLVFGGGGGQGQQVINRLGPQWCKSKGFAMVSEDMTRGGNGGGVVLITAKTIKGKGKISADGTRGGCAEYDGAGGGGAGGSVSVESSDGDFSGVLSANGGAGGDNVNTNSRVGPGGGGGGGRVLARIAGAKVEVKGGKSGMHYRAAPTGGGSTTPNPHGATDGADGVIEN